MSLRSEVGSKTESDWEGRGYSCEQRPSSGKLEAEVTERLKPRVTLCQSSGTRLERNQRLD